MTFTANERPKLSVLSQILQLIELVVLLLVTVKKGFIYLVIARSIARTLFGVINMVLGRIYINISPIKMLRNMIPAIIGSTIMVIITILFGNLFNSMIWSMVMIVLCSFGYLVTIMIIPESRNIAIPIIKDIIKKFKKK